LSALILYVVTEFCM